MGIPILEYHERTKHHFGRFARSAGHLDWATQPNPFRRFEGARRVPLPRGIEGEPVAFDDLFVPGARPPAPLDVEGVSDLLFHSLAVSAWKAYGDVKWELRVNPSSGNLHPTEAYLLLPPLPSISGAPGLFHYAPKEHELEERCRWKPADWARLTAGLPADSFFLGLSSVTWREAWKYGERAFRYCQHDLGHALAAIALAAALRGWRVRPLSEWPDEAVAALLGLDRVQDFPVPEEREEPETLLLVSPGPVPAAPGPVATGGEWSGTANRLSPDHHPWPVIEAAAAASRSPGFPACRPSPRAAFDVSACREDARALIRRRRSAVAFDGESEIHVEGLVRILARTLPGDGPPFDALPMPPAIHLAIFVHRVDGLAPGLYLLVRERSLLGRLKKAMRPGFAWKRPDPVPAELPLYLLAEGDFRDEAARLSCGQDIAGDSFFSLGMIADFAGPIATHGDFAWRRLFWEAGAVGQVLYLMAEAEGARGTGIGCYFDDPVHGLLGLPDRAFQSLYHFTIGIPVEDTRLTTLPAYGDDPGSLTSRTSR